MNCDTLSLFRALQLRINSDGKKIERAYEAWGVLLWLPVKYGIDYKNTALGTHLPQWHHTVIVPPRVEEITTACCAPARSQCLHSISKPPLCISRGEKWTREPFASESTSRLECPSAHRKKVNPWLPFASACNYLFSAWVFWGAATDHSMLLFYFDFPSIILYHPSCSLSLSLSFFLSFFVHIMYVYGYWTLFWVQSLPSLCSLCIRHACLVWMNWSFGKENCRFTVHMLNQYMIICVLVS